MAISFPISLPTIRGAMQINWRAIRADSVSRSPLTYSSQVIRHQGQMFEADLIFPPMDRAEAEQFTAFMLKLDGRFGTFTMTPPEGANAMGTAKDVAGSPVVSGAGQTGAELVIGGLPASEVGYLLTGDYIQTGTGATSVLHKVLTDVTTSAGGLATLDIWPSLRTPPVDGSIVIVSSPQGLFRLAQPLMDWSISSAALFGISISVMEDV